MRGRNVQQDDRARLAVQTLLQRICCFGHPRAQDFAGQLDALPVGISRGVFVEGQSGSGGVVGDEPRQHIGRSEHEPNLSHR